MTSHTVVGLIPAAGQASRMGGLPFSKELFPVDVSDDADTHTAKPIIEFTLDNMRASGIGEVYVVIRDGKWDIPRHLGDGSRLGLSIAYLMMGRPYGVPYSLDQGYAPTRDKLVALGFPDHVLGRADAFELCLAKLTESGADVMVGCFPADFPSGVDMVDARSDGRVNRFVVKPESTSLTHAWAIATWTPAFSAFMHDFLAKKSEPDALGNELQVADVFNAALTAGLDIRATSVSEHPFVDIGTPGGLARFARHRARLLGHGVS